MTELDEKLRRVKPSVQPMDGDVETREEAEEWSGGVGAWFGENKTFWWTYLSDDAIEQIKQAFIDAGEFQLSNISFDKANQYTITFKKPLMNEGYMTGQEWYSAFEKEYHGILTVDDNEYTVKATLGAAKRAAGLEVDKQ